MPARKMALAISPFLSSNNGWLLHLRKAENGEETGIPVEKKAGNRSLNELWIPRFEVIPSGFSSYCAEDQCKQLPTLGIPVRSIIIDPPPFR